jgi:tetratricopeptide (TPR) repeat protein
MIGIENNAALSNKEKLTQTLILKKQFEDEQLIKDSVYARILHKAGLFEFNENNQVATKDALLFTHTAISINSSGQKNSAPAFCFYSYNNLGKYYESLKMYYLAAQYYDSAIVVKKKFPEPIIPEVALSIAKAEMLHKMGDFQKAIEEVNIAIPKARADQDSAKLQGLLNQRALSYLMEGELETALTDINLASRFSKQNYIGIEATNNQIIKA